MITKLMDSIRGLEAEENYYREDLGFYFIRSRVRIEHISRPEGIILTKN